MPKILIADDSETILLLLRTRLEMEGYEVVTAVDGQEVLDVLHRDGPTGMPDVLLLDAMMPRMSGFDALRALRGAGIAIPALIVSAHQHERDAAPPGLDVSGYVSKPIDFDLLLRCIADLVAA